MLTKLEKQMQEKYNLEFDSHGLLCPFHNDNRGGSFKFSIYNKEVKYKCFSCNESGNELMLRQKVYENNFELTEEERDILHKKYSDCSPNEQRIKREYFKKMDNAIGKLEKKSQKDDVQAVFTDDELDLIHSFYDRVIEQTRLSKQDKAYLLNERKLTEEEIQKYGYRSFNDFSTPVIENVIKLFNGFYLTAQMLRIPGIYLDEENQLKFKSINGLVIPITQNGKYVGLQVRSNSKSADALRYFWVSSADKGGTSPGAQWYSINEIDLSLPWIITEGQFKAAAIDKHLRKNGKQSNVISIQGIGNGLSLVNKINEMYNDEDNEIERTVITLALDKDTVVNENGEVDDKVLSKIKTINGWLNKLNSHKIYVMTWSESEKGIDDVLAHNTNTEFSYITYEEYTKNL